LNGPRAEIKYFRKHLKYEKPWTLDGYRQFGGYQAWEKILRERTPRRENHR